MSLPGRNATWHLPMCFPILTEHNVDVPSAATVSPRHQGVMELEPPPFSKACEMLTWSLV